MKIAMLQCQSLFVILECLLVRFDLGLRISVGAASPNENTFWALAKWIDEYAEVCTYMYLVLYEHVCLLNVFVRLFTYVDMQ